MYLFHGFAMVQSFCAGKPAHFQDTRNVDWIPTVDIIKKNYDDDKLGNELYDELQVISQYRRYVCFCVSMCILCA